MASHSIKRRYIRAFTFVMYLGESERSVPYRLTICKAYYNVCVCTRGEVFILGSISPPLGWASSIEFNSIAKLRARTPPLGR